MELSNEIISNKEIIKLLLILKQNENFEISNSAKNLIKKWKNQVNFIFIFIFNKNLNIYFLFFKLFLFIFLK